MSAYVAVSFHQDGDQWFLYGHRSYRDNDYLGSHTLQGAIVAEALQHGVPVVQGTGDNIARQIKAAQAICPPWMGQGQ